MITNVETGSLKPFDFNQVYEEVPELKKIPYKLNTKSFNKPIDSSNVTPEVWKKLGEIIKNNYNKYDGFVVLHGSDTMAYSASALSFMLKNLNKPVVFTGSQLPIGVLRTDGKENLVTAIEIAGAKKNNKPIVPEVSIYFEYKLYRGNRTTKLNSEHFEAFESLNYPTLAKAGINIEYNYSKILDTKDKELELNTNFNQNVAVLTLFPGISKEFVNYFLCNPNLKGVVLHTFGAGNALSENWFLKEIDTAIKKGIIILNITQCKKGNVVQGLYETSEGLEKLGVLGGKDMTLEAAITKMMLVLGNEQDTKKIKKLITQSFSGEISN